MSNISKERALITGITGFAGSHLAELLLSYGYKVSGIVRARSKTDNIDHIRHKLHLEDADLLDSHSLYSIIGKIKPNYIFHLAAQSFVQSSWASPANTMEINIVGSVNLFEAVKRVGLNPVIQIACSSEEYGLVYPSELPVKEDNPLRPQSPYAVSKVAMDYLGYQYFQSYKMIIIRTRGFNHTGPRRGEVFVTSNFARQIAMIEKGKVEPVIHVGDLTTERDWTDVRDMVKGYLLAVQKGKSGEVYNICSEKAIKVGDMLNMLLSYSRKKVKIRRDISRLRPSDVPILLGNCSKFKKLTGWKPEIPFAQTMKDLLNYWRGRV
ncbi:GDP-mannose 4,6-dehydratase [Candidatus Gottesmanbacteria bacterium]|nr:GDP-mannose 4,6-dehydratase [Candidatus Gottesmanbacteria bacterium]